MNSEINDDLIQPISQENPFGRALIRDPLLIKLKGLRQNNILRENNIGDNAEWTKKRKNNDDWKDTLNLCEDILTNHSKDLMVLCYYIEANLKCNGFSGMIQGISLLKFYVENSWEDILPALDEENLEARLLPFQWLSSNLPVAIRCHSLLSEQNSHFTWFEFENSTQGGDTAKNIEKRKDFTQTLSFESQDHLNYIYNSFMNAAHLLEAIDEKVVEIANLCNEKTSLQQIVNLCEKIAGIVEPMLAVTSEHSQDADDGFQFDNMSKDLYSSFEDGDSLHTEECNLPNSNGRINSSKAAYKLIEQANEYLLKNNPHSPAPFLIRRALEWQELSLYELFMELFTTTSKPSEIFTLLGLSDADRKKKG